MDEASVFQDFQDFKNTVFAIHRHFLNRSSIKMGLSSNNGLTIFR